MKKYLLGMVALMALVLTACSYDDSELWDKVNDLDNRVKTLEGLCREMNTNIESLETILESLNENEHVSNIAPITEDGEVVGYTITFTSGESVTIYNNEAGGTTPSLGVAKDEDGLYYWTLDGEWLLDNAGNKVKAEGTDGLTPRLKVEGGYWYVSYDNGATWVEAGAATTEGSGDNLFKEVSYDDEYVYLTLAEDIRKSVFKIADRLISVEYLREINSESRAFSVFAFYRYSSVHKGYKVLYNVET